MFHETRSSSTGDVSCATCHDAKKTFTDSPLAISEGICKLRGARNARTVINSAYNATQFWDGRSPELEEQVQHPYDRWYFTGDKTAMNESAARGFQVFLIAIQAYVAKERRGVWPTLVQ